MQPVNDRVALSLALPHRTNNILFFAFAVLHRSAQTAASMIHSAPS